MKKEFFSQILKQEKLMIVIVASSIVSCNSPQVKNHSPRPVKIAEAVSLGVVKKSFSGVVSPEQFSDLAFKMSGPLVSLNIDEGEKVKAGQIIAEIDPQDFKWEYEAKKSSFQTAKAQLDRAKRLLAKQAISKQEYESTEASFSNAEAAFNYAENMLKQTKLTAPFDGFIQKKYVENYQKVQAGQGIVCLINPDKLQIQFTMPETNMVYFSTPHELFVEFDNYKGKLFKADVKDFVEASPDGSGLPVYLTINDKDFNLGKYKIAIGFSCRVILEIKEGTFDSNAVLIPMSAIVADSKSNDKFVFIYNSHNQKVEKRKIKDGGIVSRDNVIIIGGIKAGESVVVAGATRLADNQQVKLLTE